MFFSKTVPKVSPLFAIAALIFWFMSNRIDFFTLFSTSLMPTYDIQIVLEKCREIFVF